MRKFVIIMTLPLLLLLAGCKPQVPSQYIQPDDLEDLLYDWHMARAAASINDDNEKSTDYEERLYFLAVLKKYGVTEADFDSSMVYYYSHADRMAAIYRNIEARMDMAAQKIGAGTGMRMETYGTTGDTANVWNGARSKVLTTRPLGNRLDFHLKADTTYHANDMFQLCFVSTFLYQEGTKDAIALIAVKYESEDGDTIISRYQRVMSSGETKVILNEKNNKKIKDVYGYIYLSKGNSDSKTLKLMVIDQLQLVRFHQEAPPKELENPVANENKADSLKVDSVKNDSAKVLPLPDKGEHQPLELKADRPRITPTDGNNTHRMMREHKIQPIKK